MKDGSDSEKVEPNQDHQHLWQSIPNWSGRYRCSACQGIGYRALVTAGRLNEYDKTGKTTWVPGGHKTSQIVSYLCKKKGCGKAAISVGRKGQFCKDHTK